MDFKYLRMEHHILQDAREKIGLTQQQVADEANIKLRQYQRYESGERNLSSASFDIARRVLEALKLDMSSYARGDHSIYEETVDIPLQAWNNDVSATDIFRDKICVFIGKLERCSRQTAQERLFEVGGVSQNSLAVFVKYIIAGKGAETTKAYKDAERLECQGFSTILTEQEFFDTLDGKFTPPENTNGRNLNMIHAEATIPTPDFLMEVIEQKRAAYVASKRILVQGGYLGR
ncbi:hypothetical protein AGMMS49975_28260 [Clostridia bacterium]|nr:hypothetical protein AGMMS49975_28260 [Clostridia bacterium]